MRRADPFASFIPRRDHKKARVKQWQTGITQARQRVILRQVWVFDWQKISRGLEKSGSPIT